MEIMNKNDGRWKRWWIRMMVDGNDGKNRNDNGNNDGWREW